MKIRVSVVRFRPWPPIISLVRSSRRQVTFWLVVLARRRSYGCLAIKRPMGPVVIVVVFPLAKLGVEQMDIVGDALLVEKLIELLVIDPV